MIDGTKLVFNNFLSNYVDFHTKCENPHIAIVQFSRLGRQFP